jgi:hypothetical protein
MEAKASIYIPHAFRSFQGFSIIDIKEPVQKFNEALNEERKEELQRIDPEGEMGDLMNGKYRYVYLTKAENRSKTDTKHINKVMRLNERMTKLELIKETFHAT